MPNRKTIRSVRMMSRRYAVPAFSGGIAARNLWIASVVMSAAWAPPSTLTLPLPVAFASCRSSGSVSPLLSRR